MNMDFTDEQITRYSRHILLPEVGGKGQKKIAKSRILIVGAGGLGSPAALYLAAAGVGTIGIIDSDVVDLSNLQRQVIHHTSDLDRSKVRSAKEKIQATEAFKLALGVRRPLTDRLLDFAARRTAFREIKTKNNPNCPLCGDHPTITELFDHAPEVCDVKQVKVKVEA